MSLLVTGTVAFDAIETPFGKTDKIIGGAATYVSLAASYFTKKLGLIAVVMQTRQSADSNVIGAFTARLQYLLAEAARLEQQIQALKARRGGFKRCLFDNMVGKKKRLLEEAAQVDETLRALLQRNT